jgi:hypothetical protein
LAVFTAAAKKPEGLSPSLALPEVATGCGWPAQRFGRGFYSPRICVAPIIRPSCQLAVRSAVSVTGSVRVPVVWICISIPISVRRIPVAVPVRRIAVPVSVRIGVAVGRSRDSTANKCPSSQTNPNAAPSPTATPPPRLRGGRECRNYARNQSSSQSSPAQCHVISPRTCLSYSRTGDWGVGSMDLSA